MSSTTKPKYITQSTVLSRGWTMWAIKRFLGAPDTEAPNPHYRHARAPMRLYDEARVVKSEAMPEFVAWFRKLSARRSARVAAAEAAKAEADRAAQEMRERHERGDAALRLQLVNVNLDQLLPRALDAMFALNRHAKHIRWDRATTARICAAKDAFLDAVVRAGRAKVETFEVTRNYGHMCCPECGHAWVGDSWCYACGDDTGEGGTTERWFIVDCGGHYRFHQPRLAEDLVGLAVAVPAHDPTQPAREVPDIGISVEMQFEVIAAIAEMLVGSNATRCVA